MATARNSLRAWICIYVFIYLNILLIKYNELLYLIIHWTIHF